MASQFLLQIIDRATGDVVLGFEPGSRIETAVIDDLVQRVIGQGVGVMTTSASVERIMRAQWSALVTDLKLQVMAPLRNVV